MEKQVLVNESSLINIADALRIGIGETYTVMVDGMVDKVLVSKSPNALDKYGNYDGPYTSNLDQYETLTIPGAATIEVELTTKTHSTSYDYVQICAGEKSAFNTSSTKYGGTTLTTKTLTFTNTDTITIRFKTNSDYNYYFGYWAEVKGYDSEGVSIKEPGLVPEVRESVFKPAEMGPMISQCLKDLKYQAFIMPSSVSSSFNRSYPTQMSIATYIDDNTPFYLFMMLGASSGSSSSNTGVSTCLYYDGENEKMTIVGVSVSYPDSDTEAKNIKQYLDATYLGAGIIKLCTSGSSYIYIRQSGVFLLYQGEKE